MKSSEILGLDMGLKFSTLVLQSDWLRNLHHISASVLSGHGGYVLLYKIHCLLRVSHSSNAISGALMLLVQDLM
jgi:hypothetical protein